MTIFPEAGFSGTYLSSAERIYPLAERIYSYAHKTHACNRYASGYINYLYPKSGIPVLLLVTKIFLNERTIFKRIF